MIVELCTNGLGNLEQVSQLGINRIELCSALEIGGLSPSRSVIKNVRGKFEGEIFAMVRPRGGNFCYSKDEFGIMKHEIAQMAKYGVDGVVFGVLNKNNQVDKNKNQELLSIAKNLDLKTTFHRAIDLTPDLLESFSLICDLNFNFILTSGGKQKAIDAKDSIRKMIDQNASKTKIIVGSGVNSNQVSTWKEMKVDGIHFTARKENGSIALEMGSDWIDDWDKMNAIITELND